MYSPSPLTANIILNQVITATEKEKTTNTRATTSLLTPPPTVTTKNNTPSIQQQQESPEQLGTSTVAPNNVGYYTKHLNKSQFNSILINCSINLLKIIYGSESIDTKSLSLYIFEILRRSKTSIQTLQLTCFYLFKLIKSGDVPTLDPKKLFLGMIIVSSKFNQDYNYSMKSWLKILGLCPDDINSIKMVQDIERSCLSSLNYELFLSGLKYENWCNVLIIFGYDFIKRHNIKQHQESSEIIWETNHIIIENRLNKWKGFFEHFKYDNLNFIKINFHKFFQNQINKKVFILKVDESSSSVSIPPNRKRCGESIDICLKKQRIDSI